MSLQWLQMMLWWLHKMYLLVGSACAPGLVQLNKWVVSELYCNTNCMYKPPVHDFASLALLVCWRACSTVNPHQSCWVALLHMGLLITWQAIRLLLLNAYLTRSLIGGRSSMCGILLCGPAFQALPAALTQGIYQHSASLVCRNNTPSCLHNNAAV